jgi:hypothetical protein
MKKTTSIIIIIVLTILVVILYFKNVDLKYELLNEKSIPDVELINYLSINSNIISGAVTGYVVFDNKEKQPQGMRQYVKIEALANFTEDGKQLFSHTDIIKMNVLPPSYFEPVILTAKDTSGTVITLTDITGNLFFIDKITKEVSMLDSTGDVTKLITKDSDFRNFIREL